MKLYDKGFLTYYEGLLFVRVFHVCTLCTLKDLCAGAEAVEKTRYLVRLVINCNQFHNFRHAEVWCGHFMYSCTELGGIRVCGMVSNGRSTPT